MKQVIEEDVEFRESNNYNFPTPPHTSPYINGEVFYCREDIIHISHPQLTINHLSKTSTMFWGYNETSSQFENYINTFAST